MIRGNPDPIPPTCAEVARALALAPHPEGGYFRETYRSAIAFDSDRGRRSLSTAISFLVATGSPSRFHRLTSDELWIYQGGEPLELLLITAGGDLRRVVLGDPRVMPPTTRGAGTADAPAKTSATMCVPAGVWQAARVSPDGGGCGDQERSWTLVTCVVSPGFEYEDFELGERGRLLDAYPEIGT